MKAMALPKPRPWFLVFIINHGKGIAKRLKQLHFKCFWCVVFWVRCYLVGTRHWNLVRESLVSSRVVFSLFAEDFLFDGAHFVVGDFNQHIMGDENKLESSSFFMQSRARIALVLRPTRNSVFLFVFELSQRMQSKIVVDVEVTPWLPMPWVRFGPLVLPTLVSTPFVNALPCLVGVQLGQSDWCICVHLRAYG